MKSRLGRATARILVAVLTSGLLAIPVAAPVRAVAAATTVSNGITTADLSAINPLDQNLAATSLAQALAGPGVTVSNVTYKGANAQLGTIHVVDPAVVSFNDGVILSSGNIADIIGPNKSDGTTGDMAAQPGINAGAADTQLTALIANTLTVNPMTYDAAVLEFDFVPQASQVYFTYTFGSDEYLEWVNLFNDVFAFYVNGTNCAMVPGPATVSIDTINDVVNPQLYRDNSFAMPPANPINIESDGLSVELICSATVTPNATNHMKLAIADTSDQILDSVVMIKAGSLSTTKPESCNDGVDNNDDTKIDMGDPYCQSTTTPAPSGSSSGIGNGGNAPAFTGNEGTPIKLDASVLGASPTAATVSTTWQVAVKGNPAIPCVIENEWGQVITGLDQPLVAGAIAPVYAVCPNEDEYTARIDMWDDGHGSDYDTDVDFFVHNAPPSVTIDAPAFNGTALIGEQVNLSATVTDPGVNDIITCAISWGDGSSEPGAWDAGTGLCTGAHTFADAGMTLISVTATDDAGDSAATATAITIDSGVALLPQAITFTAAPPASAEYGSTFTVSATGGGSGNPLVFGASGGCVNTGADYTMISATADCGITVDQAGDATYDAAPQASATVAATLRAITATADSGQSKAYGDPDPALTWTITTGSLVPGDNLTGTLDRATGEGLGTYGITQGTLAAPDTYDLTFVGADFEITGTAPAVTADPVNQTVVSGSTASFSAAATGNPAPGVQWQTSTNGGSTWTDAPGATSTTWSFTAAAGDDGTQVHAVFSNGVGSAATTGAATLTVVSIASFSPTSGNVGSTVTITGTGLNGVTGVSFNGTAATSITLGSRTSLTAVVPTGATSGPISVTKSGVTATSVSSFTVTVPPATPTISSISPTSGGVGTSVTITGTNLAGTTGVTFNGTSAWFKVLSNTSVVTSVPAGATTGAITVTTSGGSASSRSFRVSSALAVPSVSSYSPVSIRAGSSATITVSGSNLAGATAVRLNGVDLTFDVASASSLRVTIPASGVTSGPIRVTTAGGTSTNTAAFLILAVPAQLAGGGSHSCAVVADGSVKCWGLNTSGQLGDGTTTQRTSPVLVSGISGATSVAAGGAFSCAVVNGGPSGTASCWGLNSSGQLGDGTTTQRTSPVTVLAAPATPLTGVVSVAAGDAFACALLSDGTLRCWGANGSGQLGGASLTGVTAVAADGSTACALLSGGGVRCWGSNSNGQLGIGTTSNTANSTPVTPTGLGSGATAVTVGGTHACALLSDGTVKCWGANGSGQLGDGTTTQRTSPVAVLTASATSLTGITSIAAGQSHTCAITGSGAGAAVRCWGLNKNGQLGDGSTTNRLYATAVAGTLTTGVSAIASGGSHTLALVPSTALWPTAAATWGLNKNGQLGIGSTSQQTSPVALTGL